MNRPDEFVQVLHQWIEVFMHRSMQNLHKYSKESGFSMSQIFALTFVSHRGTCGVTDLAEGMGVSNAAASQLLDKLVQQQLIGRTEDPSDRRGKQITLTAKGTQVIQESLSARHSWFSELEGQLSEHEKQQVNSVLKTLIKKGRQLDTPQETAAAPNNPIR